MSLSKKYKKKCPPDFRQEDIPFYNYLKGYVSYQILTRFSGAIYIESFGVIPKASYHAWI